jgi:23S rRNA pseudouridine1911/1915/1917 synthase
MTDPDPHPAGVPRGEALDALDPGPHAIAAEDADAGERLDRMLARRFPSLSRSRLKGLIEAGAVTRGGATIDEPSTRVKPGQSFVLTLPEAEAATPEPQAIPLAVVYEDPEIIVVDKPAGMVVHPAPGNPDRTLVNALLAHCGESLKGIGGVRRPGIVHRLDKGTSGVMVAAKTEAAQAALTARFTARDIERAYLALVWGRPLPTSGEISGNIGRSVRNRKKMALLRQGGKPAVTRYRVLESFQDGAVSLVECRLLTGRTHQIRVHMSSLGHPLLGDPVYGRAQPALLKGLPPEIQAKIKSLDRQALHARSLGFVHPTTGQAVHFDSAPPEDLQDLIALLGSP